jgi:hypothetical protein
MNMERPLTGAERAKRWRAAMRAKGLKPRTFWLPDTSTPEYKEQARRDSEALTLWHERHPEVLEELQDLQYWPPEEEV